MDREEEDEARDKSYINKHVLKQAVSNTATPKVLKRRRSKKQVLLDQQVKDKMDEKPPDTVSAGISASTTSIAKLDTPNEHIWPQESPTSGITHAPSTDTVCLKTTC